MKKWAILLAATTLTGCATAGLPEADYFELVREREAFTQFSDDNIRQSGKNVCAVFDTAEDPYVAALDVMLENDIPAGDAGAFIALAVMQYCPANLEKIPDS